MPKQIERKVQHLHVEVKDVGDDGTFSGYGSKFGIVDSYGDVVEQGAFARTLAARGRKTKLLWQHQGDVVIGHFTELYEDAVGLKFTAKLNLKTQKGEEAYELLKAGDIDGMSIGYVTVQSDFDEKTGIRHIKEVKLYEISVVTFPALEEALVTSVKDNSGTSIEVRFEALTNEQRAQVLTLINSFNASLQSNDPPISEASEEKHSLADGPDKEQRNDPQPDYTEILHSLDQLTKSMTL